MSALLLATSFSHVVAPPGQAALHNAITANAGGDPVESFFDNESIWAYMTSDLAGGQYCIVAATGDGSCDDALMGTGSFVGASIGTLFRLVKNAPLTPGTYRLLLENSVGDPTDYSEPFTVLTCLVDCDLVPDAAIVQAYKDAAAGYETSMAGVCAMNGALEKVAGDAIGLRGIKKPITAKVTARLTVSTPRFAMTVSVSGTLLMFTVIDPFSHNIDKALEILKEVSCGAQKMYRDMVADPPDPNYETVTPPEPYDIDPLTPASLDDAVASIDRERALQEAVIHAFERYQGAAMAGDTDAQIAQLRAAGAHAQALSNEMFRSADALRSWADDAANDPDISGTVLSSADAPGLIALYQRVRDSGFTTDEVDQFHALGYTDADVAEIRTHASAAIEEVPTDTAYPDALRAAADDLESEVDAVADFASEMYAVAGRIEAASGPVNEPPVASFTADPTSGNAPLTVSFESTSTDADGDTLTASWDFGDGQTGSGPSVTHEYPAGIYTATLVVSDGSLTDFATTSIVASAVGVNHDPTLADDVAVTAVNTPVNVLVLSNDFDQDGQVVTVSGATTPSHGSVTCSTDGDCLYVPDLDYTGPDAFDYTASDGVGGSATASVSVTVTPGADDNAPPIAADDDLTVVVNKAAPVYVLGNDSDADGDSLSITLKTQTANGDVSCVSFGYCTYTPAADYVGPDTFEYTVADGRGGTDVATVNVTVEANHDPVAVDDVLTTRENAPDPRSVNPIANDSDPDGDPLTLVSNTDPAHGTVDCPSICLYMPAADYVGPDTFDYVVSDGAGGTDSATVNVIVTANHLPVAVDDTAQTVKTKPVAIPILTNDFDEDLDSLAVTDNTQPSHGTVDCSPVIFCDYTPDPAYVGSDGFDYTLSDGTHTSVGHVTISVEPPCFPARCIDNGTILLAVNPAGHLNSDDGIGSAAGAGSVGLDFLATNNDATAPGCLCEGWGAADAGTGITGFANVSTDAIRNIEVESFIVTSSTAVSVVTIDDTLRVTHDYHPSTATPNLYEVTVTIENISGGPLSDIRYRRVMDWDIEPTAFSEWVTIQGGNASALLFDSNNGFETANPLGSRSDRGFTGDFVDAGPDDHGALFDFGFGALADGASTTFNIFYGAGATEDDAEAAINAVGAEVYSIGQPTTEDGKTLGTPNTFIFAFGSVGGDPIFSPIAVDDTLTTEAGVAADVNVLANDSDPDEDPLTVTTLNPTADHGTVSCTASGVCTYTPAADHPGGDSFDYDISDGNGGSDTGTVAVTVLAGPQTPVGNPDSYTTPRDTALIVPAPGVLANDTDADGDALTAAKVADPTHGTLALATDGSFVYTPATDYAGPDSFTYELSDGTTTVGPVTVSITVIAVNHPPVGAPDSYAGPQDSDLVIPALTGVLANDDDADGDTLTATIGGAPSHGSVTLASDGSFRYVPDPGYIGPDSFTYNVSDASLTDGPITVSLTIEQINHAPTLADLADQVTPEMQSFDLALAGADADGDTLAYSAPTRPAGLTVDPTTGNLSWTPGEADGPGVHPVTVRVTDPDGLFAEDSFTITVTEINRLPSLAPIADQTVHPGDVVSLTASATDPDLPANTLTYDLVSGPAGATVDPSTGAFAWTAGATLGDYPATIAVSDGAGGRVERSFTLHVVRDETALTLGGDTSGQYSDEATITAALKVGGTPIAGASVTIDLGSASQTATTNASGVASAIFTIAGPAGTVPIGASFAGTPSRAPSSASGTFAVNREDSTIVYSGDTIGLAGSSLNLSATFTDSAAAGFAGPNPETGGGAAIGDITKARVAFAVYAAASCLSGSPITTLSAFVTDTGSPGDGIGRAAVDWASSSEGSFCIAISLVGATGSGTNGYYAAPPAAPAGLAVFIDTAGKVTGGGWVALADGRANFGFNATSTGSRVRGSLVFVERSTYDGKPAILIVKSNAIDTLRTSGSTFPITATLSGKASYRFISAVNGSTLAESGNATFSATVTDIAGKGGAGDTFAIRVLGKSGAVLVDLGATTLGGGNIVAHIK